MKKTDIEKEIEEIFLRQKKVFLGKVAFEKQFINGQNAQKTEPNIYEKGNNKKLYVEKSVESVDNIAKRKEKKHIIMPKVEKIKDKNDEKIKGYLDDFPVATKIDTEINEKTPIKREVGAVSFEVQKNAFLERKPEDKILEKEEIKKHEKDTDEILESLSEELEFFSLRGVSI